MGGHSTKPAGRRDRWRGDSVYKEQKGSRAGNPAEGWDLTCLRWDGAKGSWMDRAKGGLSRAGSRGQKRGWMACKGKGLGADWSSEEEAANELGALDSPQTSLSLWAGHFPLCLGLLPHPAIAHSHFQDSQTFLDIFFCKRALLWCTLCVCVCVCVCVPAV